MLYLEDVRATVFGDGRHDQLADPLDRWKMPDCGAGQPCFQAETFQPHLLHRLRTDLPGPVRLVNQKRSDRNEVVILIATQRECRRNEPRFESNELKRTES